jgi:hypothetical protein
VDRTRGEDQTEAHWNCPRGELSYNAQRRNLGQKPKAGAGIKPGPRNKYLLYVGMFHTIPHRLRRSRDAEKRRKETHDLQRAVRRVRARGRWSVLGAPASGHSERMVGVNGRFFYLFSLDVDF